MRTIHKFEIAISKDVQTIELPEDIRYLHAEYLLHKRSISLWVEVPAEINNRKEPRRFRVFSTGDGIPDSASHIGTCVDQYLPESYHLYELLD